MLLIIHHIHNHIHQLKLCWWKKITFWFLQKYFSMISIQQIVCIPLKLCCRLVIWKDIVFSFFMHDN